MDKKISELQDATTTKGAVVVVVQNGGNFKMPIEDIAKPITYLTDEHLDSIEQEGTYVQMTATKATEDKGYPKKGLCRLTVDVFGSKKIQTLIYMNGDIFFRVFRPNGEISEWKTTPKDEAKIIRTIGWTSPSSGTTNHSPQHYLDVYGKGAIVEEVKRNNEMGITGAGEWGRLTTRVNELTSAGNHIQEYRGNTTGRLLIRTSVNATTWGAWKECQFAPMA